MFGGDDISIIFLCKVKKKKSSNFDIKFVFSYQTTKIQVSLLPFIRVDGYLACGNLFFICKSRITAVSEMV